MEVLEYRRAAISDVAALCAICRRSFGHSIRWQCGDRVGSYWWISVLRSTATQVVVATMNRRVVGFLVLVFDDRGWRNERSARNAPLALRILGIVSSRAATVAVVRRVMQKTQTAFTRKKKELIGRLIADVSMPRMWIELIATDPEVRGRGVGLLLLGAAEQAAREHGYGVVGLTVSTANVAARRIYEKAGFTLISASGTSCIYEKLTPPV